MDNESLMRAVGPWVTPAIVEASRPKRIHVTPGDDHATAAALLNESALSEAITPSIAPEYGMQDFMALMTAHMGMMAKTLERKELLPFRIDANQALQGANSRFRAPNGVVKFIHNTGANPVTLGLAEDQNADPFYNFTLPAGFRDLVYIQFARGILIKTFTLTTGFTTVVIAGTFY